MSTDKIKIIGGTKKKFREKHLFAQGLSKLDISKIQINSAIKMLFGNMNPISVHTVVSSGYQIVRDLAAKAKTEEYLMFTARIKEDRLNEFWKHVNKAWVYFKHADRDSEKVFDGFDELVNDFAIFMAIRLYRSLGGELSIEMNAFAAWFTCTWPQLLIEDAFREFVEKNYKECNVDQFSREEILQMGKLSLAKMMAGPTYVP